MPAKPESAVATERLQQALGLGVVLVAAAALIVASSWDDWFTPHTISYSEAEAFFSQEDWASAVPAFEQLVERHPNDPELWFRYAFSVHANGEFERALPLHRRASEYPSYFATARYNLACALSMLGHLDEALDTLEDIEQRRQLARGLRRSLLDDPELDPLRHLDRFNELLDRVIPPEERNPPPVGPTSA